MGEQATRGQAGQMMLAEQARRLSGTQEEAAAAPRPGAVARGALPSLDPPRANGEAGGCPAPPGASGSLKLL